MKDYAAKLFVFLVLATLFASGSTAAEPIYIERLQLGPSSEAKFERRLELDTSHGKLEANLIFELGTDTLSIAGQISEYNAANAVTIVLGETVDSNLYKTRLDNEGRFAFRVNLADLGLPPPRNTLLLSTSVGERSAPQPFLSLEGIHRDAKISPIFGWIPRFLPVGVPVYTPQYFRIETPYPEKLNYRASIEMHSLEPYAQNENPRYDITASNKPVESHFEWMAFTAKSEGMFQHRLGFVWDGVKWYQWEPNDLRKKSYSLNLLQYSLLAALASIPLLAFVSISSRISNFRIRFVFGIISIFYTLFYALEFLSPLLPHIAILILATAIAINIKNAGMRTYWLLIALCFSQEYIWSYLHQHANIPLKGVAFSLSLAATTLAPLVLIRRQWLASLIGIALSVSIVSAYVTMDIYLSFFDDFPSINVLRYSGQGVQLVDSIAELMKPSHETAISSGVWISGLILVSAIWRSLEKPTKDRTPSQAHSKS